ncbi:MAG: tetratricopeptide repeat protein, partial [Candidatus Binataceae bacterium]
GGAAAALRNLLEREPDNVAALNILGAVMLSEHRYADALAAYERAASIVPRDASLHYRVAIALHAMGRNREALKECAAVLAAVPNNPGAMALRAEIERSGTK